MPATRSFLFLQGPVGPFFDRLGGALAGRGHRVLRVNFNGGDVFCWRGGGARCYRGRAEHWPMFLRGLAEAVEVDDLVVFGDCRPRHRMAIRAVRPLGTRVHVFEEGYFRPDWITLEPDGVNGHSRLPRDPDFYRRACHALSNHPWPATRPVGPTLGRLVYHTLTYYGAMALLAPLFRHHRTHRLLGPRQEAAAWIRRALSLGERRRIAARRQARLLAGDRPYFVLALQLDTDMQVRRHCRFADMAEVMVDTVSSFARRAPPEALLVVKNHPLDCGRVDYERLLHQTERIFGIEGRTLFLDGGDLPGLLAQAQGLVVVNSTAGLSGLHRAVPTIVLGRALYDIKGLTHGADQDDAERLDRFWQDPRPPDMELYRAFRRVVMERTQINGGFYTRAGLELALPVALERLEAA